MFVYVAMWDKHRKRIGVILYRRGSLQFNV